MLSNFKSVTMGSWGKDIVACKIGAATPPPVWDDSQPSSPPQPAADFRPFSPQSASAAAPPEGDPSSAGVEPEMDEGEAYVPDVETDEDLPGAFMAAVDRHDHDAVLRGLQRARQEGDEEDVEALVSTFDADGNTMLHRCAIGPVGSAKAGPDAKDAGGRIMELLIQLRADVNEQNLLGETPVLSAVRAPGAAPLEMVRILLEAQASPGSQSS